MKVSVIATVRNETGTIDDLISSLLAQTRSPEEIVIADGGSTDDTVRRIEGWINRGAPIRLLKCPGANIAAGRNRAIDAAAGEIIASTDAGVRLDPHWLEKLIVPFESGADVSMGFFQGAPQTLFERALAATTLPDADEIDPDRFVPSSRSIAYTRAAWKAVGGYPEWLDYCEDVVFDLKMRSAGFRFAWQPDAVVYYRPRTSVRSYARQYFFYARGDGKAELWPRRQLARYLTYTIGPLVTISGFWYKRSWLALILGAGIYLNRPIRRLARATRGLSLAERVLAFGYVPYLRLVGDIAKMIGYPVGVWWRLRRERTDG
jgi:glycosyltransferase involved in cell wall biosynthesis